MVVARGPKYRPSGKISPLGLLIFPLYAALLGLLVGLPYGWLTYWSDSFILDGLWLIGFALFLMLAVEITCRASQSRNTVFGGLAGLVVALATLYAAWMTYFYQFPEAENLFLIPQDLWTKFQSLEGSYFDRFCWGIEGVFALYLAVVMGVESANSPYCERCGTWANQKGPARYFPPLVEEPDSPQKTEEIRNRLERGDWQMLEELAGQEEEKLATANAFTQIQPSYCPKCHRFFTLDIHQISTGEEEDERKDFILAENLMMRQETYRDIFGEHQ